MKPTLLPETWHPDDPSSFWSDDCWMILEEIDVEIDGVMLMLNLAFQASVNGPFAVSIVGLAQHEDAWRKALIKLPVEWEWACYDAVRTQGKRLLQEWREARAIAYSPRAAQGS